MFRPGNQSTVRVCGNPECFKQCYPAVLNAKLALCLGCAEKYKNKNKGLHLALLQYKNAPFHEEIVREELENIFLDGSLVTLSLLYGLFANYSQRLVDAVIVELLKSHKVVCDKDQYMHSVKFYILSGMNRAEIKSQFKEQGVNGRTVASMLSSFKGQV